MKLNRIDAVINFTLDENVLVEKLGGRRVCPSCGIAYNLCEIHRDGYEMYPLLPKKDRNKCDKCDV